MLAIPRVEGVADPEWARLEQALKPLRDCVGELERALPKAGLALELRFTARELTAIEARARKVPGDRIEAIEACAADRLVGFRLREHAEPLTATVTVTAAAK